MNTQTARHTSVPNPTITQPEIPLHESRGEARVDSRIIAKYLAARHQDTFELIKGYAEKFKKLGFLLFQTGKIEGRGRPEKFALLNEDQAYFLLTLSRNTDRVIDLKLKLVIAFRDARNCRALHDAYLPGYHELHDEIAVLAQRAKDAGSQTDEALFHINFNKLVNKTAGIAAGARHILNPRQKLMVTNAQIIIGNAVSKAMRSGKDHRNAYKDAKNTAEFFTSSVGQLLGAQP